MAKIKAKWYSYYIGRASYPLSSFLSFSSLTHSYIPTVTNKSMQISQHVWFSDSVWGPHRLIKTLAPPSSQSGEKEEVSATPYITHPSGCKCVCVCGLTELLMWKLGLLKKGENDKKKKVLGPGVWKWTYITVKDTFNYNSRGSVWGCAWRWRSWQVRRNSG